MTLGAIVLCQFEGCCDALGRVAYFAGRVVSVLSGIALAAFVSSFILPWYTSTWALETMAEAYKRALALTFTGFNKM